MSYFSDLDIQIKESGRDRERWQTERWENFGGDPGYPKQKSTVSNVQREDSTCVRIVCRKCNRQATFLIQARDAEWEKLHDGHGLEYHFS